MPTDMSSIDKVLFIVHLAIGDYTYMQRCFEKLKNVYPNLKISLFIQDNRRTEDSEKWAVLDNYILYEWLQSSKYFDNIYKTYSPQLLEKSSLQAQNENYPLVISLGDLRSQNYSALARKIAKNNIALGIDIRTSFFHFNHRKDLALLDGKILDLLDNTQHISNKFAYWFSQIANLKFSTQDLYPKINIPHNWQAQIDAQLQSWIQQTNYPVIFINIYAKGSERCWTSTQAIELIKDLKTNSRFIGATFILNRPPEASQILHKEIQNHHLKNTYTFCATNSFFELPALLKRCHLIITVDTSIMHLACISDAHLISLIRKKPKVDLKWLPLKEKESTIIYTQNSKDSISAIKVQRVMDAINKIELRNTNTE